MEITISDIAFLIIALSFGALVAFLIKLILTINRNLESLKTHVDELAAESKEMASSLNYKMSSLDPIFRAVSNLGERAEYKTRSFKERSVDESYEHERTHDSQAEEIIMGVSDLALLGVALWNKYKNRR